MGKRRILGELPCDPDQLTDDRIVAAKKSLEFNVDTKICTDLGNFSVFDTKICTDLGNFSVLDTKICTDLGNFSVLCLKF